LFQSGYVATGGRRRPVDHSYDRLPGVYLESAALIVDDYDRAIEFFVGVLGFELVEDSPALTSAGGRPKRWVVVRPPGERTGLLIAQADGPEQLTAVGRQFAGRVGWFLRVDDFEDMFERLRAAGVTFEGSPRSEPYGRAVVFLDVAGNRWDLLGPAESQNTG
jgi:catechol 2,3-dioxygenase-like lactoylglutathione lyase family enzyme